MHYEGPIYRPPSEANSLLIQATAGCPHNKCTFCMVYKNSVKFKIIPVKTIKEDILEAFELYGKDIKTLFFPAGNSIAMKTDDLCEISQFAKSIFPKLSRITVYGSFQYIHKKGIDDLKRLKAAGLSRIHVGLETGDDLILKKIKKGTNSTQQIEAGKMVMDAGIELSLYVILGIGGKDHSDAHALNTAKVLNKINPTFIRLRTFVPKKNTPLLEDVLSEKFQISGPHDILKETELLIKNLNVNSLLVSDHYTNYINIKGQLPEDRNTMCKNINNALKRKKNSFREFFIGTE